MLNKLVASGLKERLLRRSELPKNEKGRFYHIDCGPGDLASYILTCGDPARAKKIARLFDQINARRRHREFITYTGTYKGIPLSVMATGIGPDNTAITMVEASQCISPATFIRLGSCGALQEYIFVGEVVITESALRDENTTYYYARPDLEARSDASVTAALKQAAQRLKVPHYAGVTCTTSDFYGGQGRQVPGFPIQNPNKVDEMRKAGVLNFEMEMSVYLTLAQVSTYDIRAGGACAVFANRITGTFASSKTIKTAEMRCIEVGLLAVELLHAKDNK